MGWITINRPDRANSIDRATRSALREATDELEADTTVRVVVLTGSGRTFCAGTDLKERPAADLPHPIVDPTPAIATAIDRLTKPVIAAVNGPAAGGGFELALACDLRIASSTATFALPEVRVGSLAGSGGTQRLFRVIPAAVAWKILLTGRSIDAVEAHRIGLVSDVVEPTDLHATVNGIAADIAANAPLSVKAAKLAARAGLDAGLGSGLALERTLWTLLATTEDRAEGRAAFAEARPPRYRGR